AKIYIVLLAICGLGIQGRGAPDYPSVSFNLWRATWATYRDFIGALRERVTRGTEPINGVPVLRPANSVPVWERFVLVRLINHDGNIVTLAVDVVNLYVVAFSANRRSYFFRNSTELQRNNLFVDTTQTSLPFTVNYGQIEKEAGVGRQSIPLGPTPLADATTRLWYGRSVAEPLLVVIQMVSEAARFGRIEELVRRSITDQNTFTPRGLMLSMENKWSPMSLEVQRARDGVIFSGNVTLRDDNYSLIEVDNFNTLSRCTMVAVLLWQCIPTTSSNYGNNAIATALHARIKRMLVFLVGKDYNNDETCTILESTRHISGRDGLCVDVRDGHDNDGNPIQLWPCGQQRNQQWTFHTDGTIRSMGKCMTTYGYSHGDYVMIFDCSTAVPDATKWVVSIDGSITNPHSGLVLTAPDATQGTTLLVENNIHAARQGWSVGEHVEPTVTFIVGYKEMCLQANNEHNHVWLEDCVLNRRQQRWALYGDSTIRVDTDRSLCVTSDGHSSSDVIIILKCQGWGNQRWVFNPNGAILNPNAKLVMDVKGSDVSLRQIILFQPNGNPNQQWLTQTHPEAMVSSGKTSFRYSAF
ncbi:unnamed protein product, partial [Ilex paraguariensis]